MDNNLKEVILNGGLRQDLARRIVVLSRLEDFRGLSDLRLTAVRALDRPDDMIYVEYRANASPEVCRRLKSALIEGGVIGKYTPRTQTIRGFPNTYMRLYFDKEGVEAEIKVSVKK